MEIMRNTLEENEGIKLLTIDLWEIVIQLNFNVICQLVVESEGRSNGDQFPSTAHSTDIKDYSGWWNITELEITGNISCKKGETCLSLLVEVNSQWVHEYQDLVLLVGSTRPHDPQKWQSLPSSHPL